MSPTTEYYISPFLDFLSSVCVNESKRQQLFTALDKEVERIRKDMGDLAISAVLGGSERAEVLTKYCAGQIDYLEKIHSELKRLYHKH